MTKNPIFAATKFVWGVGDIQQHSYRLLILGLMLEEKLKRNLADNLIRLRVAKGYTQEELVTALKEQDVDISRTALASYENQRSFPKLDVLYTLSRFFDTDIENLLQEKAQVGNVLRQNSVCKVNLDDLLQDFSEVLLQFKLFRGMYFNLAEKVMSTFATPENHAEVLKMIMGVYANEQLKQPKLNELFQENLDKREVLVLQGIHNGVSIEELATELNADPAEITDAFIRAKDKVFDLLLKEDTF